PESGGVARDAPAAPSGPVAPAPASPRADSPALEHAREVLATIQARGGEPLAGYVGGRAFQNRERRRPAGTGSTMCTPESPGATGERSGSSSSRAPAGPTTQATTTAPFCR